MIYKSFNLGVIIRLCIFGLAAAGTGIGLVQHNWFLTPPLMLMAILSCFNLIYFLNSINRRVAFFFEAVTNDDTTLHFSEQMLPRSLHSLHQSMNRLNEHIAEIKNQKRIQRKIFFTRC